jgi:uncharacterized membrane protein YadS
VIAFVLVSALATVGIVTPSLAKEINVAAQWAFTLAFVGIGLDFSVSALREAGWKPLLVYLAATIFNTVLALLVASVIFWVLL